ncbi:MAG: dihydrodipicolinate synthase family protein [Bacteroidales bacterium]|nr:dihydrodipicolinate synthase family protein [Bacteroidales bacterium]
MIPEDVRIALNKGAVIPALPLALNSSRRLDERRQRALIRYYLDAGAGGIAVAVHTTQFAIRLPGVNLFIPLLEIAREEFDMFSMQTRKPVIRIAGAIGRTGQAMKEAEAAARNGFNVVLLSLVAFRDSPNRILIKHCREVANILPVMGFYLQPAVGGRILDINFWREFSQIENVIGVKIAPFNRYQTLDVVRGVAESGRADKIALYTGNDDNILVDLLTEYTTIHNDNIIRKRIVGGLLGHWAVWTLSAVKLLENVQKGSYEKDVNRALILASQITDCNSAFFDTANNFKGCIVGLHEVLRRQGLFKGLWTLDRNEKLSPGQKKEIDRVYSAYPELNDDEFVAENLHKWLS